MHRKRTNRQAGEEIDKFLQLSRHKVRQEHLLLSTVDSEIRQWLFLRVRQPLGHQRKVLARTDRSELLSQSEGSCRVLRTEDAQCKRSCVGTAQLNLTATSTTLTT